MPATINEEIVRNTLLRASMLQDARPVERAGV
jgi:hypothetical protein